MSSYTQEVFPSFSLDKSSIDFEFETNREIYLHIRDTHLSLEPQIFKERLFDAFKKIETKKNQSMTQMRNQNLTLPM